MQTKSGAGGTGITDRSPMQTFFLARMQHLIDQRVRYTELLAPEDWRNKLLARAIYSSYRDLLDLDLGDEARTILEHGQAPRSN